MDQPKSYVAFFDLDGTLLNINSGEILVKNAYRKGFIKNKDLLYAFYLAFLYKFKLRRTSEIIQEMPGWLKGIPEKKIKEFTVKVFKDVLIHHIRPAMYKELEMHRQNQAQLVILSAAFNYICTPVAQYLGMDDIICSHLEVIGGRFTGNPIGSLCFNDEKLKRMNNYCKKYDFNLQNAYYYADSISDFPVLDCVGYPKCINPDKKLVRIAIQQHWPVFFW